MNIVYALELIFGLGLVCGLAPYLLAVIMPSWRWLVVCAVLVAGGFAYLWIHEWILQGSPGYKSDRTGLGPAIVAFATAGFVVGVAVRATSLWLAWAHWRRTSLYLNFAGFAAVIGVFAIPYLWSVWLLRPVSAQCATARFALQIGGAQLRVPASPLFNIYLGRDVVADAYYLGLVPSLRALCSRTNAGRRTVRATNIALELGYNHAMPQTTCADVERVMGAHACESLALIQHGKIDETDYPISADVFAPDEIKFGQFGARRSTYEDATNRADTALYPEFFRSSHLLANGTPVTFACRKIKAGHFCRAAYPWRDGAHLYYTFDASPDDVVAKGLRVDARVRDLFGAMLTTP